MIRCVVLGCHVLYDISAVLVLVHLDAREVEAEFLLFSGEYEDFVRLNFFGFVNLFAFGSSFVHLSHGLVVIKDVMILLDYIHLHEHLLIVYAYYLIFLCSCLFSFQCFAG